MAAERLSEGCLSGPGEDSAAALFRAYGFACQEAKRRGYHRAITYTRPEETGSSLRAAGFVRDGMTKGGSWHRKNRPRPNAPKPCPKQRWRRDLDPSAIQLPVQLELLNAA
jgi:hypothetical protein